MSDCGVCIGVEPDPDGVVAFFEVENRTARKEYVCCECNKKIVSGERYEYSRGKIDDEFWQARTCAVCAEIGDAFSCNGRCYGGGLWEDMSYIFDQITTGCFERLKTVAAKTELQRRVNEWRFES